MRIPVVLLLALVGFWNFPKSFRGLLRNPECELLMYTNLIY